MIEFELSVEINARRQRVWDELADIPRHVEWMEDAQAIRFSGTKTSGTGTSFECDTKVGFFRTTDRMTISQWIDGHTITINHEGNVKGSGKLSLSNADDKCLVTWHEELTLPWYFGAVVGEQFAKSILTRIWSGDLQSFKDKCEHERDVNPLEYFAVQNQRVETHHKGDHWVVDVGDKKDFATGPSAFAARYAAVQNWQSDRSN